MIVKNILAHCNQEGVELSLNGENLDIAFDKYPSEALVNLLKENKPSIIAYIADKKKSAIARKPALTKPPKIPERIYSSFSQDMLWFLSEMGGESARYNMNYVLKVKGDFDIRLAEQAFSTIIKRHAPLRTNLKTDTEGKVTAFVNPVLDFRVEVVEPCQGKGGQEIEKFEAFKRSFHSESFALDTDLLLRVAYWTLDESKGILLINMHHIASDGWSLGVLIDEFKQLYFAEGNENLLPPLPYSYSDYAYWQRHFLGETYEKQLAYWNDTLDNLPTLHSLPTDHLRPSVQEFLGDNYSVTLSERKLQQLSDFVSQNNITMFMFFHAAFALLLSKYSYSEDIVIGTLLANRVDKNLESLIGFFANTVVLRTPVDSELSFIGFLSLVKQVNLDAQDNQDVPFEKVVEEVNPTRSRAHTPLCQIMMALDNTPKADLGTGGVEFTHEKAEEYHALFDLFLKIEIIDSRLSLRFNYSTSLFEAASIKQMADALSHLTDSILRSPDSRIGELSCFPQSDCEQLLPASEGEVVSTESIPQIQTLFERQVTATPQKVAVRFGDKVLTYDELNVRSNKLAHRLRSRGVTSESIVALYTERSLEMVIGILGVLKSGAAYLPLEPFYPDDRLRYMLENSGCETVLVPDFIELRENFEDLDCLRFSANDREETESHNPALIAHQGKESLAYVIYTSGSTGRPKGVMITHDSLHNRIDWMQKNYQLTGQDTVLQKTPFSFDVSVWEFIWPLSYGGGLDVLPAEMHKDPDFLLDFIRKRKISILHFVPSMFRHLLDGGEKWSRCESVKQVFSSGESLPPDLVTKHRSLNCAKLHNLYGPTEASIDVTHFTCGTEITSGVPIGKAIQNTQLYILDKHERTLPVGAIGELHIGGRGLAQGYINSPELTKSKFICKHEERGEVKRLYKTGDLVRCDVNGDIHYLGRLDTQVKIRGFRIELGEIEQSLMQLSEVKAAVVTCQKDGTGSPLLIAYVVFEKQFTQYDINDKQVADLSNALQNSLPNYMIPSAYIPISEVPVSVNGKLNTKALPPWKSYMEKAEKIAPGTDIEVCLANIWAEVLGLDLEALSIDKSFFSFGGNSLSLVRLRSQIEREFSVDIPTAKLFDIDTIIAQAELVEVFLISQTLADASAQAFVEEI